MKKVTATFLAVALMTSLSVSAAFAKDIPTNQEIQFAQQEFTKEFAPGLYKYRIDTTSKTLKANKLIQNNPELLSKTQAYQTLTNDEEFNEIFGDIELLAGVGEEDVATYVFEDGSTIEVSLKTDAIVNGSEKLTTKSVDTDPDGEGGYNSTYSVKMSHLGINNVHTTTLANWTNNISKAKINDHETILDMVNGTGSSASKIQKDNANPSIVRGTFQLSDYFGMSTVTKITELSLYPGTTPLAGGKIAK